jgi:hypothetical protein
MVGVVYFALWEVPTNILKQGNNSQSMVFNISNLLKVCHQNIRGPSGKTEELLSSLLFDRPHA